MVLQTLPILGEVGDSGLLRVRFVAELGIASLVLVHCKHVLAAIGGINFLGWVGI